MKKSDYSFYYKKVLPLIRYNMDYYKMNNLIYTYKDNNIEELKNILKDKGKYVEIRVKNIEGLKMNISNVKKETNINNYWQFNDIILVEKR